MSSGCTDTKATKDTDIWEQRVKVRTDVPNNRNCVAVLRQFNVVTSEWIKSNGMFDYSS